MANLLVNTLSRYCYWYGRTTPEYQEVPPATPPPDIHPGRLHPAWVEGRINIMNHNNAGKAKTANVIGKMVAQLVNELKPDNIPHPQINYYFLKQWYVFKNSSIYIYHHQSTWTKACYLKNGTTKWRPIMILKPSLSSLANLGTNLAEFL